MPPTGTSAVPVAGTSRTPTSSRSTGTAATSTGRAHQAPDRSRVSRRPAVALATVDISARNATVSGSEDRTAVTTRATASSCSTARPLARSTAAAWPSPPATLTAAASPAQLSSTATSAIRDAVLSTSTSGLPAPAAKVPVGTVTEPTVPVPQHGSGQARFGGGGRRNGSYP